VLKAAKAALCLLDSTAQRKPFFQSSNTVRDIYISQQGRVHQKRGPAAVDTSHRLAEINQQAATHSRICTLAPLV
jgi:hypothetical protein